MKLKYLFLMVTLALSIVSCEDSEDEKTIQLELSETSFSNISFDGETLDLTVSSNTTWTVSSDAAWCTATPATGNGTQKLTLTIQPYSGTDSRKATMTVSSGNVNRDIQLSQDGNPEYYHYTLPVIFHVLYKDAASSSQHVSQERLSEILDKVNKYYQNAIGSSVDMNLTFTFATEGPDGTTLTTPGVEYLQWTEDYPIDCEKFMNDESGKYAKLLWDPNTYINVMVYNFVGNDSGSTILGISHLPFSTKGSTYLDGLNSIENSSLSLSNIKFPYSVSINSLYIDKEWDSTEKSYSTVDVNVTLTHELGHYLGLHHVFSEDEHSCKDTDYCEDTPSYDMAAYMADYQWAVSGNVPEEELLSYLVKRKNCEEQEFTSYNFMDYAISYFNQFTEDQRDRIRHVLMYSPLIPGPKKGQNRSRAIHEGPIDLPIRTIK